MRRPKQINSSDQTMRFVPHRILHSTVTYHGRMPVNQVNRIDHTAYVPEAIIGA